MVSVLLCQDTYTPSKAGRMCTPQLVCAHLTCRYRDLYILENPLFLEKNFPRWRENCNIYHSALHAVRPSVRSHDLHPSVNCQDCIGRELQHHSDTSCTAYAVLLARSMHLQATVGHVDVPALANFTPEMILDRCCETRILPVAT